jgi:hypothetical protein
MYSLMLGKPFRRADFSNSLRSSAVNRTLVISLRGEDVFGRKESLPISYYSEGNSSGVIVLQEKTNPK